MNECLYYSQSLVESIVSQQAYIVQALPGKIALLQQMIDIDILNVLKYCGV